jgi:hypothetical protein
MNNMNNHMDDQHEGRWKFGDKDVIQEFDEISESNSDSSLEEEKNGEVLYHPVNTHAVLKGEVSRI